MSSPTPPGNDSDVEEFPASYRPDRLGGRLRTIDRYARELGVRRAVRRANDSGQEPSDGAAADNDNAWDEDAGGDGADDNGEARSWYSDSEGGDDQPTPPPNLGSGLVIPRRLAEIQRANSGASAGSSMVESSDTALASDGTGVEVARPAIPKSSNPSQRGRARPGIEVTVIVPELGQEQRMKFNFTSTGYSATDQILTEFRMQVKPDVEYRLFRRGVPRRPLPGSAKSGGGGGGGTRGGGSSQGGGGRSRGQSAGAGSGAGSGPGAPTSSGRRANTMSSAAAAAGTDAGALVMAETLLPPEKKLRRRVRGGDVVVLRAVTEHVPLVLAVRLPMRNMTKKVRTETNSVSDLEELVFRKFAHAIPVKDRFRYFLFKPIESSFVGTKLRAGDNLDDYGLESGDILFLKVRQEFSPRTRRPSSYHEPPNVEENTFDEEDDAHSEGGGAVVSQITPRPRDSGMSSDLKTFAKSFLNENRSSVASFAGGGSSSTADQPRLTTARVSLLGGLINANLERTSMASVGDPSLVTTLGGESSTAGVLVEEDATGSTPPGFALQSPPGGTAAAKQAVVKSVRLKCVLRAKRRTNPGGSDASDDVRCVLTYHPSSTFGDVLASLAMRAERTDVDAYGTGFQIWLNRGVGHYGPVDAEDSLATLAAQDDDEVEVFRAI